MSRPTDRGPNPTIAIVGSGPAGCYAAQFLRKQWPDSDIAIFDSMPVPYGLIRYGIAPDHQGNKSITQQFERLFERQQVQFVGGVEVGTDIGYEELADTVDILVIATGMETDRSLPIPCNAPSRILGAGKLMRALNGDPHSLADPPKPAGSSVVIVGNGNVSLDAVRMLVAPLGHFDGSDVDDVALAQLRHTPVTSVDVLGRSPADRAKFDLAMLREICQLPGIAIRTVGLDPHDCGKPAETLRSAELAAPDSAPTEIRFWFNSSPTSIESDARGAIVNVNCHGEQHTLHAATVITAIGFEQRGDRPDQTSVIGRPGVFTTGWRRRGAQGGVAANRRCAQEVVKSIVDAVQSGAVRIGSAGLTSLEPLTALTATDYTSWRRIDAYETSSAAEGRCRTKITDIQTLHDIGTRNTDELLPRTDAPLGTP